MPGSPTSRATPPSPARPMTSCSPTSSWTDPARRRKTLRGWTPEAYGCVMTVTSLYPIILTRDLPRLVSFYEHSLRGVVSYRFGDAEEDDYVTLRIDAASLGI